MKLNRIRYKHSLLDARSLQLAEGRMDWILNIDGPNQWMNELKERLFQHGSNWQVLACLSIFPFMIISAILVEDPARRLAGVLIYCVILSFYVIVRSTIQYLAAISR
jgi:hypothetical protein